MPRIEQAVITADESQRPASYRIVARSNGLVEADARELAGWCPTHDALRDPRGKSINFHPLPSGAFCVSQTTMPGAGDGFGTQRSVTHCLVVSPELLARFSNNPFALLRTAIDNRIFDAFELGKAHLDSLPLVGGAPPVDSILLAELAEKLGTNNLATMVHLALNAVSLAVAGASSASDLIEGLLYCVPPQCRPEFSFSTGLKFSPRRPFRLLAISDDPAEQTWVANHPNVTVFRLGESEVISNAELNPWARLIARVLSTERTAFFGAQLSKRRIDLTLDDLPALGLQLIEEIDACEMGDEASPMSDDEVSDMFSPRAHAAHHRFEKSGEPSMATKLERVAPATNLPANSPELLEQLEYLDDLVYDAINGQPLAMQQLRAAWPKMQVELGEDLLAESREQYLRYAMSVWEETTDANAKLSGTREPARAVQVLDVLCLLFGDASMI